EDGPVVLLHYALKLDAVEGSSPCLYLDVGAGARPNHPARFNTPPAGIVSPHRKLAGSPERGRPGLGVNRVARLEHGKVELASHAREPYRLSLLFSRESQCMIAVPER